MFEDFIPAVNNMIPLTPNFDSQISIQHSRTSSSSTSLDGMMNDEATRLYQEYKNLADNNRK